MSRKNVTFIFFGTVIIFVAIMILLAVRRNRESHVVGLLPSITEQTQIATTTALIPEKNDLKIYENKELRISFMYPTSENFNDGDWSIGKGTTGKAFQATIKLPSGAVIYAYSTTKDYSVAKGGFSVSSEGFVVVNGEYYVISRGNPVDTSFVPAEVWKLSDGSMATVLFG